MTDGKLKRILLLLLLFSPGKGTTDAIFIVRQVQEKLLGKQKELWMAFVDLEKAFDRVPREVVVGSEACCSGRVDGKCVYRERERS